MSCYSYLVLTFTCGRVRPVWAELAPPVQLSKPQIKAPHVRRSCASSLESFLHLALRWFAVQREAPGLPRVWLTTYNAMWAIKGIYEQITSSSVAKPAKPLLGELCRYTSQANAASQFHAITAVIVGDHQTFIVGCLYWQCLATESQNRKDSCLVDFLSRKAWWERFACRSFHLFSCQNYAVSLTAWNASDRSWMHGLYANMFHHLLSQRVEHEAGCANWKIINPLNHLVAKQLQKSVSTFKNTKVFLIKLTFYSYGHCSRFLCVGHTSE